MRKTLRNIVLGALALAVSALPFGAAFAISGTPPGTGFQLVDSAWLNALAGGLNATYQSGLTAAGTTQATALQLPSAITLLEMDTVAASTGVNLPPALPGVEVSIYNNGAQTLTVYPTVANNPVTAAQDTINNSTSTTASSHSSLYCFSAKAGIWACK